MVSLGFAGDNQFSLAPKYWGGTKYNIDRNLTNKDTMYMRQILVLLVVTMIAQ